MMPPERQNLRDLLACTSPVQVSPDFCQRVTLQARSVHQLRDSPVWFRTAASAAAAVILALGATLLFRTAGPSFAQRSQPAANHTESWTEEFESIVLMDELLAVNDPAQLDDEALSKLLTHSSAAFSN